MMKRKQIITIILCFLMVITMLPAFAFAEAGKPDSQLSICMDDSASGGFSSDVTGQTIEKIATTNTYLTVKDAQGNIVENVNWSCSNADAVMLTPDTANCKVYTNPGGIGKTTEITATVGKESKVVRIKTDLGKFYVNNSAGTASATAFTQATYRFNSAEMNKSAMREWYSNNITVTSDNEKIIAAKDITLNAGTARLGAAVTFVPKRGGTVNLTFNPPKGYEDKAVVLKVTVTGKGLYINPSSVWMEPGDSRTLTASLDEDVDNPTIDWKSNATDIVTVDTKGVIKAIKNGTATVTASYKNETSTYIASCTITVKENGIYIMGGEEPIKQVDITTDNTTPPELEAWYQGQEKNNTGYVIWQSGNTDVVLVQDKSSGKMQPMANGNTVYRATYTDRLKGESEVIGEIKVNVNVETFSQATDPENNYVPVTEPQGTSKDGKETIWLDNYNVLNNPTNLIDFDNYITNKIDANNLVFDLVFTGQEKKLSQEIIDDITTEEFAAGYLKKIQNRIKLVDENGKTVASYGNGLTLKSRTRVETYPMAAVKVSIDKGRVKGNHTYMLTISMLTPCPYYDTPAAYLGAGVKYIFETGAINVAGITLNKTNATINVNETLSLSGKVSPENADDTKIIWSSSNSKVAAVDKNGKIKGITAGKAVITAKTSNGGKIARCSVTVNPVKVVKASLSVKSNGYNSLKIIGKAKGADGYRVYRSTSPNGKYQYIRSVKGASGSFINANLKSGKKYYYKIKAYDKVNGKLYYGTNSRIKSAKPIPKTPKLSAKGSARKITVKWSKSAGADHYQLYKSTSKKGHYIKVRQTIKTSYADKKVKRGKHYYYKVRAYKTVGGKKIYSTFSALKVYKAK